MLHSLISPRLCLTSGPGIYLGRRISIPKAVASRFASAYFPLQALLKHWEPLLLALYSTLKFDDKDKRELEQLVAVFRTVKDAIVDLSTSDSSVLPRVLPNLERIHQDLQQSATDLPRIQDLKQQLLQVIQRRFPWYPNPPADKATTTPMVQLIAAASFLDPQLWTLETTDGQKTVAAIPIHATVVEPTAAAAWEKQWFELAVDFIASKLPPVEYRETVTSRYGSSSVDTVETNEAKVRNALHRLLGDSADLIDASSTDKQHPFPQAELFWNETRRRAYPDLVPAVRDILVATASSIRLEGMFSILGCSVDLPNRGKQLLSTLRRRTVVAVNQYQYSSLH